MRMELPKSARFDRRPSSESSVDESGEFGLVIGAGFGERLLQPAARGRYGYPSFQLPSLVRGHEQLRLHPSLTVGEIEDTSDRFYSEVVTPVGITNKHDPEGAFSGAVKVKIFQGACFCGGRNEQERPYPMAWLTGRAGHRVLPDLQIHGVTGTSRHFAAFSGFGFSLLRFVSSGSFNCSDS
jgi:hypothetical protein